MGVTLNDLWNRFKDSKEIQYILENKDQEEPYTIHCPSTSKRYFIHIVCYILNLYSVSYSDPKRFMRKGNNKNMIVITQNESRLEKYIQSELKENYDPNLMKEMKKRNSNNKEIQLLKEKMQV
jgi:hypothetical protein